MQLKISDTAEGNAKTTDSAMLRRSAVGHPIRAPGLKHGEIWDQATCLFERSEFAR
jgi:hypothetical protein